MQPFSIVHEYEGTSEAFWALFFDGEYNRAFYGSVDIDFEVVAEKREGERLERVVRYRVRKPVSPLMRPFLPDGLGYTEHGIFDRAARTFTHRIEPSAFGSRTDIRGTLSVEEVGEGRIRRTYAGTVAIRAPWVSSKLEQDTISNMAKSQDVAAAVTRDWLSRRADTRTTL